MEKSIGGRVSEVVPLAGGITAGMYRIHLSRTHPVVLRRWDGRVPVDASVSVRRESRALQALVRTGVPAPRLEAVDAEGVESWLPSALPAWAEGDDLWGRAFAAAWSLPSTVPRVFLHGDFQHFNVLWRDGRLSGVVDWPNAGTGPPGIDVGHCRLNLAVLYSAAAAERFLEIYQAQSGEPVDPRADIAGLCHYGPDWPQFLPRQVAGRASVDSTGMRGRVEDVLRRALRRL